MMHRAVTASSKTFCKRIVFDLQLSYLQKMKMYVGLDSCLPVVWRDFTVLRAMVSSNKEANYGRKCPIMVRENCPVQVLNVESERFQLNNPKQYAH